MTPVARHTDPETSRRAAASVKDVTQTQAGILRTLWQIGQGDDEDIYLYYGEYISESGLRTRRSELVRLGLVEDSGRRGLTASGRSCIIWRLTEQGRGYADTRQLTLEV